MMKDNETNHDCTQAQEEEKTAALGAVGSLFGDLYKSSDFCKCNGDVVQEMQAYMKETPLSVDSNPLLWWRDTGCNRYPQYTTLF